MPDFNGSDNLTRHVIGVQSDERIFCQPIWNRGLLVERIRVIWHQLCLLRNFIHDKIRHMNLTVIYIICPNDMPQWLNTYEGMQSLQVDFQNLTKPRRSTCCQINISVRPLCPERFDHHRSPAHILRCSHRDRWIETHQSLMIHPPSPRNPHQ